MQLWFPIRFVAMVLTRQNVFFFSNLNCEWHIIGGMDAMVSSQQSTRLHFNTFRPIQNVRHFPDDIFKCIFLNENVWISLKISFNFAPMVRINNFSALIQIMAWRRRGDKPLSDQWWLIHCSVYASLGLNELNHIKVSYLRVRCVWNMHQYFITVNDMKLTLQYDQGPFQ